MLKQIHAHLPKFNLGIHFVTSNLRHKKPLFLNHDLAFILLEELDFYRSHFDVKIFAYVIMPEHFHVLIWWDFEQKPDLTISKIIQSINSITAKRIITYFQPNLTHSKDRQKSTNLKDKIHTGNREHVLSTTHDSFKNNPKKEVLSATLAPFRINPKKKLGLEHTKPKYKIWQTGAYDFNIITERKLEEKIHYIHQNPYKDARIKNPKTYPFSSERFYLYDEEGSLKIDSMNLLWEA